MSKYLVTFTSTWEITGDVDDEKAVEWAEDMFYESLHDGNTPSHTVEKVEDWEQLTIPGVNWNE